MGQLLGMGPALSCWGSLLSAPLLAQPCTPSPCIHLRGPSPAQGPPAVPTPTSLTPGPAVCFSLSSLSCHSPPVPLGPTGAIHTLYRELASFHVTLSLASYPCLGGREASTPFPCPHRNPAPLLGTPCLQFLSDFCTHLTPVPQLWRISGSPKLVAIHGHSCSFLGHSRSLCHLSLTD